MAKRLRIGTRGSRLARAQSELVRAELAVAHGWDTTAMELATEIVVIQTSGDRIQDPNLRDAGGKGLFTKEIEDALLRGQIDLAVHSTKDLLATLSAELMIGCVLRREDPRDAFVSRAVSSFDALGQGAIVGTSSPRRRAQALHLRPDLVIVELRGNVETRLQKLGDQDIDATFLAVAGLKRLGLSNEITDIMGTSDMLPAGGQGAIGIETRADDASVLELLAPINHEQSRVAVTVERAFLSVLDGSCRTPIACLAEVSEEAMLSFWGQVLLPDGTDQERIELETQLGGDVMAQATSIGEQLGVDLKTQAGSRYFDGEK